MLLYLEMITLPKYMTIFLIFLYLLPVYGVDLVKEKAKEKPALKNTALKKKKTITEKKTQQLKKRKRVAARKQNKRKKKEAPLKVRFYADSNPYEISGPLKASNTIDKLVFAKLKKLRIKASNLCSDAVFARRVFLTVTAALPDAEAAEAFIKSKAPDKRARLIDQLLASEQFADYRAMKWCDLLRVKSEFPSKLWPNAVQLYYKWIHRAMKDNMPYDQFVRAMLTSSGSNFREAPVNFYRAVDSKTAEPIARTVALTWMGARTDRWPKTRLANMALFFSKVGYKGTREWKEEIVYFNPFQNEKRYPADKTVWGRFPDNTGVKLLPDQDPREVFARWLISPKNKWFAKNTVNRIWYYLMGRGLIHEPDDIHPGNPPQNAALLDYLEKELIRSGYDLKHVYRLILNSTAYQLSSIPNQSNARDNKNFSRFYVRRMEAETLADAVCRLTGTHEMYHSKIPEPFTWVPEDQLSVKLADGSITSPFLEMFGRPPRDTGLEMERSAKPTARQKLHLLNASHIQRKFYNARSFHQLWRKREDLPDKIHRVYLIFLSRYATREEMKTCVFQVVAHPRGWWHGYWDIAWALLNSKEFIYIH